MKALTPEQLKERQVAYKLAFTTGGGQAVLRDLAQFCRANETCFHPDPRMHAVLEGRREVWLRIQRHLNLPLDDLLTVLGGRTMKPMSLEEANASVDESDEFPA